MSILKVRAIYFLTLITIVFFCGHATAGEMADTFQYQYTDKAKIVLLPDQCDKSNVAMGWMAYAENDEGERAEGCWRHHPDGETVEIHLNIGGESYIDYQFFKDRFSAVYDL